MCYLVNMISESYVEVSKNYLLDRIAGMSIESGNLYTSLFIARQNTPITCIHT